MNILLAIDNSPHSGVAVDVVLNRMWPKGSAFKVLCSVERREPIFAMMKSEEAANLQARALEAAQQFTFEVARRIEAAFPDCTATNEARFGDCRQLILANSSWPADLVVVGSRGRRGLPRVFLGSVSQAVLLQGQCTTLIARYQHAHEGVPIFDKNVLVAIDNSEHSKKAVEWVLNLPWPAETQFRLISALSTDADSHAHGMDALQSRNPMGERAEARKKLLNVLNSSRQLFDSAFGVGRSTVECRNGDAAEVILNVAASWPAGLLVLGSRSQGPMQRLLMGSVSQGSSNSSALSGGSGEEISCLRKEVTTRFYF